MILLEPWSLACAGTTKAARSHKVPVAQRHRADVRLVRGHSLQQAGKKFGCNGRVGFYAAVSKAVFRKKA